MDWVIVIIFIMDVGYAVPLGHAVPFILHLIQAVWGHVLPDDFSTG